MPILYITYIYNLPTICILYIYIYIQYNIIESIYIYIYVYIYTIRKLKKTILLLSMILL